MFFVFNIIKLQLFLNFKGFIKNLTFILIFIFLFNRGVSTTTVPLCYELSFGVNRKEDETAINDNDGCTKAYFVDYFPLIECLQGYSFQKHFLSDLIAGIALGLHSAAEGLVQFRI